MAVPKKKTSKSRRDMRRSHLALKPVNLTIDPVSGDYKRPHHVNLVDGTYKVSVTKNDKGKKNYKTQQLIKVASSDSSAQ